MPGYVRAYTPRDLLPLTRTLRRADLAEIAAHSGLSPHAAILRGVCASEVVCTIVGLKGEPVGVFGVGAAGCLWMLGSDALAQGRLGRQFLRECRSYVDILQRGYPLLFNVIDARNTVHIRWLRWMGCTFIRRIPAYGAEQRPFLEFVRITKYV